MCRIPCIVGGKLDRPTDDWKISEKIAGKWLEHGYKPSQQSRNSRKPFERQPTHRKTAVLCPPKKNDWPTIRYFLIGVFSRTKKETIIFDIQFPSITYVIYHGYMSWDNIPLDLFLSSTQQTDNPCIIVWIFGECVLVSNEILHEPIICIVKVPPYTFTIAGLVSLFLSPATNLSMSLILFICLFRILTSICVVYCFMQHNVHYAFWQNLMRLCWPCTTIVNYVAHHQQQQQQQHHKCNVDQHE